MPSTNDSPSVADADVPILCHRGKGYSVPSLSSFVLKLETYLKMTDIPYKSEFSTKSSSKGKIPFVKYEGKEIGDTNFIIPYLNTKFEKDLNAGLNSQELAISLAFKRLIEENLYWTLVYYRWIENFPAFFKLLPITGMKKRLFPIVSTISLKPGVKSSLHGHGMGRHTKKEINEVMEKDLRALSDYLGDKPFFMGAEPTEIDASLFGFLAQCVYPQMETPHNNLICENLTNLREYTDRMRDRYWPDWEKACLKEKKKEEEAAEQQEEQCGENAAKAGDQTEEKENEEKAKDDGDGKNNATGGDVSEAHKTEDGEKSKEKGEPTTEEQEEAPAPEK